MSDTAETPDPQDHPQDDTELSPQEELLREVEAAPPSLADIFPQGFDPEAECPLDEAQLPRQLRRPRKDYDKLKLPLGLRRQLAKRRILFAVKAQKAVEYRLLGYSYDEIAQQLGYKNRQGAWAAVNRLLQERSQMIADEALSVDLARLDKLLTATMTPAVQGDLTAVSASQSLINQRARLLGLEKPVKVAQTDSQGKDVPPDQAWAGTLAAASSIVSALMSQGQKNVVPDEPDVPEGA